MRWPINLATMHLSAIFRVHHLSEKKKAQCQHGHSAITVLPQPVAAASSPPDLRNCIDPPATTAPQHGQDPAIMSPVARETRLKVLELCARDETLKVQPIFSSYSVFACLGRATSRHSHVGPVLTASSVLVRTCTQICSHFSPRSPSVAEDDCRHDKTSTAAPSNHASRRAETASRYHM